MPAPSRILVRLPNWLGDVLLARPLLHALRASLPEARIAAVAPATLLELLAGEGAIDLPHPWPPDREARSRLTRVLREWRPDVALVLPPSFSSAMLAWRTGARERVGYAHEGRGVLLTRALQRPARGERHLADEYLELGRKLGVSGTACARELPTLRLAEAVRESARSAHERLGLTARDFAVLGPAALYGPAKRWPPERFAAVGRSLVARGLEVLTCGTRDEAAVCEQVAREIGAGARSIAGDTSLPELAGLCAAARIAVCNDSGLAHLCAALSVPTVAVFGSTSSAWTAPLGRAVRIVQRPPVCSPCFQRHCRIGYVCLTAVTETRVAKACGQLLAEVTA